MVLVISFGINSGLELYNLVTNQSATVVAKIENRKPPEPKEKLVPPKPLPRIDKKVLAKMKMLDFSDLVLERHISRVLDINKYKPHGLEREEYICSISSSLLQHTKGDLRLALWLAAMAQVESSYRLSADPKVSSARGFLQVIYRYHQRELSKQGISKEDLYTNPSKSILAGLIVFKKYLAIEHGDYQLALRRYRGLSVSEKEQLRYYTAVKKIYTKLYKELEMFA